MLNRFIYHIATNRYFCLLQHLVAHLLGRLRPDRLQPGPADLKVRKEVVAGGAVVDPHAHRS